MINKQMQALVNGNSQDQKSGFTPVMQEAMFKAEWKENWGFSQSGLKLIGDSRGSFFHKEEVFFIHPVGAYKLQNFKSSGTKRFFCHANIFCNITITLAAGPKQTSRWRIYCILKRRFTVCCCETDRCRDKDLERRSSAAKKQKKHNAACASSVYFSKEKTKKKAGCLI